jgi:hypothetical protein
VASAVSAERSLRPPSLPPLATLVLATLERYTAFPWPTLRAACERTRIDPAALDATALAELVGPLALQIALFNDVDDGFRVKRDLLLLLRRA